MREQFKKITENMKRFGCGLIGKALNESTFMEFYDNAHSSALVTAAHGAEIILKSCIAEEHPLLIFEKIPKIDFKKNIIEDLFEKGKTIGYADLPDLLYLSTGYEIKKRKIYDDFGRLRNRIVHLGRYGSSYDTIIFSLEVIEPLINKFWNMTIYDEINGHDSEAIYYFLEQCVDAHKSGHFEFKLSELAVKLFDDDDKAYMMSNFNINLNDYI